MFDRITVTPTRSETQFVTREVHEHRAPTDESVRLLGEMQEKAEAKLIKSVAVESNNFNCVVQIWREITSDRLKSRAIFDLNGRKMTAEEDVSGIDRDDTEKLVIKLRDAMAAKIANECLSGPLRKLKL